MNVLVAVLCILALAPVPVAQTSLDELTGVWKGRVSGDTPLLPAEGADFRLILRPLADAVQAELVIADNPIAPARASFDATEKVLEFRTSMMGIGMVFSATVAGEAFEGTVKGLALSVDVVGERITREVPPLEDDGPRETVDLTTLSLADWLEDLGTLQRRLPALHVDPFHTVSADEWNATAKALAAELPGLDVFGRVIALARLAARVGDAHTGLDWNVMPGFRAVPVVLTWFADGLFVTAVHEDFSELLGGELVRVGELDVATAAARVSTTFAAENEAWRSVQVPGRLAIPRLLHALGALDDPERLPLTVAFDGDEVTTTLSARSGGTWLTAPDPAVDPVPLFRTSTSRNYWFRTLDEGPALYLAYNRCAEDPASPFAPFFGEVLAAFEAGACERLVIDLRNNSGGNSAVLSSQLPRLTAHPRLGRPGSLVALIGPRTYSSGMMNAQQLRHDAGAVLVGQPTGGKPNSYGEVRTFRLPKSGLRVFYSTKHFRMLSDEDPPGVLPDLEVAPTSYDGLTGADPVLEAALAVPIEPTQR